MSGAMILRFPDLPGKCRSCESTAYTVRELNVSPGQDGRCYYCFDAARIPNFGKVFDHELRK